MLLEATVKLLWCKKLHMTERKRNHGLLYIQFARLRELLDLKYIHPLNIFDLTMLHSKNYKYFLVVNKWYEPSIADVFEVLVYFIL